MRLLSVENINLKRACIERLALSEAEASRNVSSSDFDLQSKLYFDKLSRTIENKTCTEPFDKAQDKLSRNEGLLQQLFV